MTSFMLNENNAFKENITIKSPIEEKETYYGCIDKTKEGYVVEFYDDNRLKLYHQLDNLVCVSKNIAPSKRHREEQYSGTYRVTEIDGHEYKIKVKLNHRHFLENKEEKDEDVDIQFIMYVYSDSKVGRFEENNPIIKLPAFYQ